MNAAVGNVSFEQPQPGEMVFDKPFSEATAQLVDEEAKKMMEDQDKLVEEIFAHEDKDKDGLISHEEFSGPKHDEL